MTRSTQQRQHKLVRLKANTLSRLTNFMLGVAWAIAFIGAFTAFTSFLKINIIFALLSIFFGAMPGLLMVLLLEYFLLKADKLREMKRQTEILEKILENTTADL